MTTLSTAATPIPAYGYSEQRVADARAILKLSRPERTALANILSQPWSGEGVSLLCLPDSDRRYLSRILTTDIRYSGEDFDRMQWLAGALTDLNRRNLAR